MATARCVSSFGTRAPDFISTLHGGNIRRQLPCSAGSQVCTISGADHGVPAGRLIQWFAGIPEGLSGGLTSGLGRGLAEGRARRLSLGGRLRLSRSDGLTSASRRTEESNGRNQTTAITAFAVSSCLQLSEPGLRVNCKRKTRGVLLSVARQQKRGRSLQAVSLPSLVRGTGFLSHNNAHKQQKRKRGIRVCCSTGLVVTTADLEAEGPRVLDDGEVQDFGLNEDVILGNVPVQSKEEQERVARTPAHPLALRWMFAAYTANCTAERTFRFAVPAVIGLLSNSLLPIAIISFAGQVGVFALGPIIGDLLDQTPRLPALRVLATMQVTSMVASACVTLYAFHSGSSTCTTAGQLIQRPWFIFLTLAGVVERLAGVGSGVAYERDWVVQLAGPNRHIALAEANALLRRLDLGSEIIGPFSLGMILSRFTPAVSLAIAATAVAAFLPLQLMCIHLTDKISRGALRRYSLEQRATPPKRKGFFEALWNGWRLYLAQPVLPASIAYVMLYFNAVLSPGGLITSFLTTQGISPQVIGGFRGACALFGFAATFLSAWVIERVGLLNAGAMALTFQASCLALAVLVYISRPAGAASSTFMVGFLACVVFSRLGMWTYDVVDTQVFQTAIPETHSSVVSTTELSLCSLAELVMLGVAMAAEDPRNFGSLAALSMASVAGAAIVYCWWILRPCVAKKELFGYGVDNEAETLEPSVA